MASRTAIIGITGQLKPPVAKDSSVSTIKSVLTTLETISSTIVPDTTDEDGTGRESEDCTTTSTTILLVVAGVVVIAVIILAFFVGLKKGRRKPQNINSNEDENIPLNQSSVRLPRFPTLLEVVVNRMEESSEKAECLKAIKSIKDHINECQEDVRKAAIFKTLDFQGNPVNPDDFGTFIMTDKFQLVDGQAISNCYRPQFNHIFLFYLKLIITKAEKNGKFKVIDVLDNNNIKMDEKLDGESKNVIVLSSSYKSTYEFIASDATRVKILREKLQEILDDDCIGSS